ncbi:hypothetical protein Btru_027650 [Bulinus truncatus]|nr:hypothetical protein Btru_027650 [Bulinus truncatus]
MSTHLGWTCIDESTSRRTRIDESTSRRTRIDESTSRRTRIDEITSRRTRIDESTSRMTRIDESTSRMTRIDESTSRRTRIDESTSRRTRIDESTSRRTRIDESTSRRTRIDESTSRRTRIDESTSRRTRIDESTSRRTRIDESTSRMTRIDESTSRMTCIDESTSRRTRIDESTSRMTCIDESTSRRTRIDESTSRRTRIDESTSRMIRIDGSTSRRTRIDESTSRMTCIDESTSRRTRIDESTSRMTCIDESTSRMTCIDESTSRSGEKMETIDDLQIIIASLRDSFITYLPLEIFVKNSPILKSILQHYNQDVSSRESHISQLLNFCLDDHHDHLLEFVNILHEDEAIDNPDENFTMLCKSIKLLLRFINSDSLFHLSKDDLNYIFDRLSGRGYIYENDYQQFCNNTESNLDICLKIFREIKPHNPDWPVVFIQAVRERTGTIFDSNLNVKGWIIKENFMDIHQENNIPDDESVVSSLLYPQANKSTLLSKTSNPELWRYLNSLGIIDFSNVKTKESYEVSNLPHHVGINQATEGRQLALHNYQKELAENALQGRNTIICAPTGSGKTIVAIQIILKHIEKKDSKKLVAFFAPTVPLVNQQHSKIKKYLPDEYKTFSVTGESEYSTSLHMILSDYHVIVMTPQILENHLKRNYLTVNQFSMWVFDECHHAHKKDPYSNLMYFYLNSKEWNPEIKLPQIVGLTASVSVGKAKNMSEAVWNIFNICGQLDAESISIVEKHEDELKEKINEPQLEMHMLSASSDSEVVSNIMDVLSKHERKLENYCKDIDPLKLISNQKPKDRRSPQYGQWAMNVFNCAKLIKMDLKNVMTLADFLVALSNAIEMLNVVQLKDVLKYLDKYFVHKESYFDDFSTIKQLLSLRGETENSNLTTLKKILIKHLVENDCRSSGIIFVRTRALTYSLTSWINQCEDLQVLTAEAFTGTASLMNHNGMSQSEQQDVLQHFSTGTVRLLVATSVLDEGIDIPECSLVVIYNHVGNEITSLQRIGRARKKGAICILLASENLYNKEKVNQKKKCLMIEALKKVARFNNKPARFHTKKMKHQTKILNDIKMNNVGQKTLKTNVPFKMMCSLCHEFVIESNNVKMYSISNSYVAVDRDILKKIQIIPHYSALIGKDSQNIGDVHCLKCMNKLGRMMLIVKVPFVVLKAESFVFDDGSAKEYSYGKKWKDVPYSIDDLEVADIERLFFFIYTFSFNSHE